MLQAICYRQARRTASEVIQYNSAHVRSSVRTILRFFSSGSRASLGTYRYCVRFPDTRMLALIVQVTEIVWPFPSFLHFLPFPAWLNSHVCSKSHVGIWDALTSCVVHTCEKGKSRWKPERSKSREHGRGQHRFAHSPANSNRGCNRERLRNHYRPNHQAIGVWGSALAQAVVGEATRQSNLSEALSRVERPNPCVSGLSLAFLAHVQSSKQAGREDSQGWA